MRDVTVYVHCRSLAVLCDVFVVRGTALIIHGVHTGDRHILIALRYITGEERRRMELRLGLLELRKNLLQSQGGWGRTRVNKTIAQPVLSEKTDMTTQLDTHRQAYRRKNRLAH